LIVTLTLNPAIDRNLTVDRLVFEDRAYILSTRESAGGRGINASSVIRSFGGHTTAIAVYGGKSGRRLEELLLDATFSVELVRIKQETRTNVTVSDKQGLAVKLNEAGPCVSSAEVARVERAVRARLKGATWLMLCGSVPPCVPADVYARLIHMARRQGVRTLVDTDGDALPASFEEKPTLACPNQPEAERLLNRALITRSHFQDATERIRAMGPESVIVSLGARGAMAAPPHQGQLIEVIPPRVDVLCPIGAGDALAAAVAWSLDHGDDFAQAVRWGVAAGTASAKLPSVSFASLAQTREVFEKTEIRAPA
jgi:6-phosphofructokinase 2